MKALNKTKNKFLAQNLFIAKSFSQRLKGLLGKKSLADGEGMFLSPAYQIHTWFMNFPIDVLFVNKNHEVMHLINCMKPFRISWIHIGSKGVIELPEGTIKRTNTQVGDSILIDN